MWLHGCAARSAIGALGRTSMRRWNSWDDDTTDYSSARRATEALAALRGPGTPRDMTLPAVLAAVPRVTGGAVGHASPAACRPPAAPGTACSASCAPEVGLLGEPTPTGAPLLTATAAEPCRTPRAGTVRLHVAGIERGTGYPRRWQLPGSGGQRAGLIVPSRLPLVTRSPVSVGHTCWRTGVSS